ncbi:LOW QUALITY PROTEIN: separin [Gadus morhua]|uniref:LOW QUALITY PROTEIN: separin n=1 Tax=Gadus morhua TaxID=8049 RepID=UPI0011B66974|nr:LOW QUALITY PROTEIN: separin [Gadus morhua]
MKCLTADEYMRRTASSTETRLLVEEVESYVRGGAGTQGRTICDRIIRACNHQLGVGPPCLEHISSLVRLVEAALCGYDASGANMAQRSPLYMEKIVFHIVKKLSSLGAQGPCSHLGGLLRSRLLPPQQTEDYTGLVRTCFAVLWNGLAAAKDDTTLNPKDRLNGQMQALQFLLLLDSSGTAPLSCSKGAEDAFATFQKARGTLTTDDGSFVLRETLSFFHGCWRSGQCGSGEFMGHTSLPALSKVVLAATKLLCKAGCSPLVSGLLDEVEGGVGCCADCRPRLLPLALARWAVKVHAAKDLAEERGKAFTECARALRSLSGPQEPQQTQAVLEGCGLVFWAVEAGHCSKLPAPVLLAWFSFLEEHQELIIKALQKNEASQTEQKGMQQALCFSMCHGFLFAYDSLLDSQLEEGEALDRVLLYCQAATGRLMLELRKVTNQDLYVKAVTDVSKLVCGLHNRRLYEQAFTLVEILCQELRKNSPAALSMNAFSLPFRLAVQSSRRCGRLERALDWVMVWLKALGPAVLAQMAEPVSLWVRTKAEAARAGEEDLRLRTLRDGFGPDLPDEDVLLGLLTEELRAYRELPADTSQERYNTLCDLLELCHEDSAHPHLRAVYLGEMARVVCFQDFKEQTDCLAVDFTHEALRLLEEEPETADNAARLKDDKAQVLLWLYICTLEKNLQTAIEKDKKRQELRDKTQCVANPTTNDMDYEDKQKTQDSSLVYEGLFFDLAAESKFCQPLERALDIWSSLLQSNVLSELRCPKQSYSSISLTAALFRLMGKPLKALEAYQLSLDLARRLDDAKGCAGSLCHSARLLLDLGCPELAEGLLGEAEPYLSSEGPPEEPCPLALYAVLLRAQCCYSAGQVERGVPFLCEVLQEVNEQRQSKSWYLLRAQALQACSSYLGLDAESLPAALRQQIHQHGFKSADTAMHGALKLLASLLVTLVGNGLYMSISGTSETRFVDQGENLSLKWLVLSELQGCSLKMVEVRSRSGSVHDAKLLLLEALEMSAKLQAVSHCAELLVVKAELEMMKGEQEQSVFDLDRVKNLLELCMDVAPPEQKMDVKIKPRKGRPAAKAPAPIPSPDEDYSGLLSTRWFTKETAEQDQGSSPPLKAQPRRWLSSLAHAAGCRCPCCGTPSLGRVTARWAVAQADLALLLEPSDGRVSRILHRTALSRCRSVTEKLSAQLAALFPSAGPAEPGLMLDVVGRTYLSMALAGLGPRLDPVQDVWDVMEAGLAFVSVNPSPVLRPARAGLMATKAMASLLTLAGKRNCSPEELFSSAWTWNPPRDTKRSALRPSTPPPEGLKKPKDPVSTPKDSALPTKTKEPKKTSALLPSVKVSSSSSRAKCLLPKTPAAVRPSRARPAGKELSSFAFDTEVPTVVCTPVPRPRAGAPRGPARASTRTPFQVYEEGSPDQEKPQPVPGAPRRTKKSRFKVDFSDESDAEEVEPKAKAAVPKKRATAAASKAAGRGPRAAPETPLLEAPVKRPGRKKTTAQPQPPSSSEDEAARPRRGRRPLAGGAEGEPEKMRTIEEEMAAAGLDLSMEVLRGSDAEDNAAANADLEVLRRDRCGDLERVSRSTLLSRPGPLMGGLPANLAPSDALPEDLSLESVQSLLRTAWLSLQHLPSPGLYPALCGLLALSLGQLDAPAAAMLHTHSLGVAHRHHTLRHLASRLKKLKKGSNELTERLASLRLEESLEPPLEGRLEQLEQLFGFPAACPETFPRQQSQDFLQQVERLPSGLTVCVLSLVGVRPGEVGESLLLTRLERGAAPITVHIPSSGPQQGVSGLVQEMDRIHAEQKVVSWFSEKNRWWEGRRGLDARLKRVLKSMEALLGCWRSMLLPLTSDPELSVQVRRLQAVMAARGLVASEDMLMVFLSAAPLLSPEDLQLFSQGLSSAWDGSCDEVLKDAVYRLASRAEPKGHVVLILDKHLQKLPWECMLCLRPRSVTRMPSLHSLLGACLQREWDPRCILEQGVDPKQVFYVLNPDANLSNTEDRFKDLFSSQRDWQGVCGAVPDSDQLQEAVATKDLYIYVGHGAGVRYLDARSLLKQDLRAAALLFGCSSAALAVRGDLEGAGIILHYLTAGCPLVLGTLWDVTDRDIDRFTTALLESWLSAGSGAPLLDYMGPARQATQLRHLVGAAPVVYGLPVHLK